jgi:hypothetical protein
MYACHSLVGTNKVGELKRTPEGYYPMIVGALNVFNSGGAFYPLAPSRHLFEDQSSSLQRRIGRAALRGEYGHPKPPPRAMDPREQKVREQEFARRNLSIYEENVCCHHMKLWLDHDSVKDKDGKPIVVIMSLVAPNGPMGAVLEKQLQNPHENVCFSIRSFTDNRIRFGIEERALREVVTFDYVNEPGIATAEKYFSPALEGFEMEMTRANLEKALYVDSQQVGVTQESCIISGQALFNAMGWNLPSQAAQRPPSLGW